MHTGLMWFDNDPRTTLEAKVQKASVYYKKKFGRLPDLCLVPPAMLTEGQLDASLNPGQQITIRAYRPVLPGHLWIGVEEQNS
jgi:hypothetical protein